MGMGPTIGHSLRGGVGVQQVTAVNGLDALPSINSAISSASGKPCGIKRNIAVALIAAMQVPVGLAGDKPEFGEWFTA